MSQTSPGWYPDPNGRYAQRYHDGTSWTEHVADAAGNRSTDPQGAAAGAAPAGTGLGVGGGVSGVQTGGQFALTVGFIAAAVGALFVLLSLIGLDWAETDVADFNVSFSLGDISDAGGDVPFFVDLYASFLRWIAILVAIGAALIASGIVKLESNLWRIAGFVVLGFAVWHLLALFQTATEDGIKTSFGAWLGLLGWGGVAVPWLATVLPQLQADKKLGA
jgi:hypothetical protein